MDPNRRSFLAEAGKFIVLTGAATLAWEFVVQGPPEHAPNYDPTDHWWGMIIDIDKCIGCGNCVRACKAENDVLTTSPARSARGSSATRCIATTSSIRSSIRPTAATTASRRSTQPGTGVKVFFVPKMCNHCAHSPCVQVCPVGATFESPDGVVLVDKARLSRLPVLRAGLSVRLPLHRPAHEHRRQVHALLPPDHQGPDDGVLSRCARPARAQLVDLKNPNDPVHEFMRTHKVHVLKPQTGDRGEGVLQRPRRGRCGRRRRCMHRRRRFHLPERGRAAVERAHRPVPVPHGSGGGRVHPRVARAGVQRHGRAARPIAWRCSPRSRSCSSRRCRCRCISAIRSARSRCT